MPVEIAPRTYVELRPGDPAPWFRQNATATPRFSFDTAAGRHVLLAFLASAADPAAREAVDAVFAAQSLVDDKCCAFFGVTLDPGDAAEGRLVERLPGVRHFWDFDAAMSRLYGAVPQHTVHASRFDQPQRRLFRR